MGTSLNQIFSLIELACYPDEDDKRDIIENFKAEIDKDSRLLLKIHRLNHETIITKLIKQSCHTKEARAISIQLLQFCLLKGAPVDTVLKDGKTPLILVIEKEDFTTLELIINHMKNFDEIFKLMLQKHNYLQRTVSKNIWGLLISTDTDWSNQTLEWLLHKMAFPFEQRVYSDLLRDCARVHNTLAKAWLTQHQKKHLNKPQSLPQQPASPLSSAPKFKNQHRINATKVTHSPAVTEDNVEPTPPSVIPIESLEQSLIKFDIIQGLHFLKINRKLGILQTRIAQCEMAVQNINQVHQADSKSPTLTHR